MESWEIAVKSLRDASNDTNVIRAESSLKNNYGTEGTDTLRKIFKSFSNHDEHFNHENIYSNNDYCLFMIVLTEMLMQCEGAVQVFVDSSYTVKKSIINNLWAMSKDSVIGSMLALTLIGDREVQFFGKIHDTESDFENYFSDVELEIFEDIGSKEFIKLAFLFDQEKTEYTFTTIMYILKFFYGEDMIFDVLSRCYKEYPQITVNELVALTHCWSDFQDMPIEWGVFSIKDPVVAHEEMKLLQRMSKNVS